MELKIKRDSNFTIHIQLKEQIKGMILNNVLENGTQLPTVRQLGEFLRINKNTVSKVYKELEIEGYAYSVKGRGTFVSHNDKSEKTKEFLEIVEEMLKKGFEYGISMDEIWGIVYSKGQHFKFLEARERNRKFAFIECNTKSIEAFHKMLKKEVKSIELEKVLIEEVKTDLELVREKLKDIELIVIPYIHYEEIKKELKELQKEIITIGTTQSLKILTYSKKLKRKNVGIVGFSAEDEMAISRQFSSINVKSINYYGGVDKNSYTDLRKFFRTVDALIICSSIIGNIEERLLPAKKPLIIFEGKYDRGDLKILKEIFS